MFGVLLIGCRGCSIPQSQIKDEDTIEMNQKSNSCENLSPFFQCACPKIRHQYAILTPYWRHPGKSPPALLTFKRHLPVTKPDVLLMFYTYKVLYTKKSGGKNCRGNLPGWRIRWRRWHARGDMREDINFKGADIESGFWLISILCLDGAREFQATNQKRSKFLTCVRKILVLISEIKLVFH